MKETFRKISVKVSNMTGSAFAFLLAFTIVVVWALTGPVFGFSDSWQLVINTGTTIVTFLMVFAIQNTQNRDSKAVQLKLDELIVASKKARDSFVGVESLTDEELGELDEEFKRLHEASPITPAMRKLHEHIAKEKEHRFNLKQGAGHVINKVNTLLNPLSGNSTDNQK
jgi:low affinity Fe/Cu permease